MHCEATGDSLADCHRTGSPQVSIVIPNHNYGRYLAGCLQSILHQNLETRTIEIIFVDDASSDGSLELARGLLADMPLAGHRVLSLPRTGRPGPVRNAGLAEARGQALLTLDPDDELLPDFLPLCLEALAEGADVVYADYLREEGGSRNAVRLGAYHKLLLANQNILSPTALFRRGLWDKGARFRCATMYEDWDFWIQLALQGARFSHVEEPLYRYRVHDANYSLAAQGQDAQSKARIVVDNAAFFPSWTLAWARGVLRGDSRLDPMPRGIIPVLPEHAAPNAVG
ncbi:MAG: glycosyltransferase [Humidesulfovibrio sp.]|nr:glycosyltransferase [Humidesulfovibrio sp.]